MTVPFLSGHGPSSEHLRRWGVQYLHIIYLYKRIFYCILYLIVSFQTLRETRVDDEANVRFVDPESEGDRRAYNMRAVVHSALLH